MKNIATGGVLERIRRLAPSHVTAPFKTVAEWREWQLSEGQKRCEEINRQNSIGEPTLPRALVICIIVCLSWAVNHYRDNAITYKAQRDKNARELKLANAAITDMQMRQRDVAALDAKYTKELADAKAENDALRDDVAAGRRRLHIKAVCQSVREATTASGVDNAASPRLADTAEQDYFTLRERLVMMQAQLEGAQQYITEQCLK